MDILSQDTVMQIKNLYKPDVTIDTLRLTPERFLSAARTPEISKILGIVSTSSSRTFIYHYYIAPMSLDIKRFDAFINARQYLRGQNATSAVKPLLENPIFVRTPPMLVAVYADTGIQDHMRYSDFKFYPIPELSPHIISTYLSRGDMPIKSGSLLSNNVYDSGSFCYGEINMNQLVTPINMISDNLPNPTGIEELIAGFFLGQPNNDLAWSSRRLDQDIQRTFNDLIDRPLSHTELPSYYFTDSRSSAYVNTQFKWYGFWLIQKYFAELSGFSISTPEEAKSLDVFWKHYLGILFN